MLKFWSEVPSARLREMAADLATWAWVALWAVIGWRIYSAIAGYAESGRILASGGRNLQVAGVNIGAALSGVPIVGSSIQGLATDALKTAGEPLITNGAQSPLKNIYRGGGVGAMRPMSRATHSRRSLHFRLARSF